MTRITSEKIRELEDEREQLKNDLANEFKFFSATDEFRDGMLPAIIAMMKRYDAIERILKHYRNEIFTPQTEAPLEIDAPPVEGDTIHFSPDGPSEK